MKKQLAFDLWYVFLGVFIVVIAEGDKVANPVDEVSHELEATISR